MKKIYFYNFCARFLVVLMLGCFLIGYLESMPSAQPGTEQQSAPPVLPQFAHLAQMAKIQKEAPTPQIAQAPGAENVQLSDETIGTQGNWIKKNEWLSKTYELRNEIQNERSKIQNVRQMFSEKFGVIDRELDAFYTKMGLEQGKLDELFNSVIKYLNKKKQKLIEQATQEQKEGAPKDRDYSIKIDTIEEQIKTLRTKLDQLQFDMKSIIDLDNSLIQRLEKADEQIKQAEEESTKIQQVTEQQWKVIDHNIARENYYKFRGNTLEKLKSIANYLENDLLRDFDNVAQVIRTQFAKVQATTEELEKEGIIIKDRSARIEKIKLEVIRKTEEEKQQMLTEQKAEVKKAQALTWYGKIYDTCTTLVARILAPIKALYNWLFGIKEPKKHAQAPETVPGSPAQAPAPTQPVAPHTPSMPQMPPAQPENQQTAQLLETILAPSTPTNSPSAGSQMPSAMQ